MFVSILQYDIFIAQHTEEENGGTDECVREYDEERERIKCTKTPGH